MAFDHHAADTHIAARDLTGHIGQHFGLTAVVFIAVGVAGIDHHTRHHASLDHGLAGCLNVFSIVVRCLAAAQNHVAIVITHGGHNGGVTTLGDRQEMV